jgi:hypothetical protein
MEIADDYNLTIMIRQGALVQLKSVVKMYWSSKQHEISSQEKQKIIEILIPAFVRCANTYPLLKIYKEVITIVIGFVHQEWVPIEVLCRGLN